MPTIKDHIAVVKGEIDATGKRLENETLNARQLIEISNRMAELGGTLNWLQQVEAFQSRPDKILTLSDFKQKQIN
jgi:hypothetical protein